MTDKQAAPPVSNAVRAAANSKGETPGQCRNCTGKQGLAILPLCFAPAPGYMNKWLSADAVAVAELARLGRALNAPDGSATWYYLRSLPTGYLYVYKPDKTWDAYVVGTDGMLNRMPVNAMPPAPDDAPLTACRREGHSNVKPRFITLDPKLEKVWIAFSQHRWTPDVIAAYEADTDSCRSQRMTELDVQQAIQGNVGSGKAVHFGMIVSEDSLRGVADFTPSAFQTRLHEFVPRAVLDLSASAGALSAAMAAASAETPLGKGVALVIPDPVGVADDHNTLRFMARQRYEGWKGGGARVDGGGIDRVRAWKRQSATHVAYVETWARQRAEWEGMQTPKAIQRAGEMSREAGSFLITEREFQEKYGKAVNEPLEKNGGLNPWHRARWVPSIDPATNKPRMTVSKFSQTNDPDDYDPRWKSEPLGGTQFSEEYLAANGRYHGAIRSQKKLERYRKRLNVEALSQFNQQYAKESREWETAVKAIDEDFAKFSSGPWPGIVCANDFGARRPGRSAQPAQIRDSVHNAVARLRSVECFYGGGAVSDASFDLLNTFFKLEPSDEKNWFAGALLSGFDLLDTAVAPGNAGTVYSAILGGATLPKSWWAEFRAYQQSAVNSVESLVGSMQQVASEARTRALRSAKGAGVGAVAAELSEVARREVVWVRAAALWDYIDTGKEHYSINVKMKAGEYLDAVAQGDPLGAGAFEVTGRETGSRGASRQGARNSKKFFEALKKRPEFSADITVPIIVEKATLERAAGKSNITQLYNIGEASGVAQLPRDMAERLVQSNTIYRQRGLTGLANRQVTFSGIGIFLSIRQFWDAISKLGETSGFNFADASVNVVGGVAGTFGGAMEIAAFVSESAGQRGAPVAASLLASEVNRAMMFRMLAGTGAGVGTLMSGISAYISAVRTGREGQLDASHNYEIAAGLLMTSGAAMIGGSLISWKAAVAARVGQQVAMRILGGVAIRTSAGALVGASATGVGIVLLIIGIAWALYAASLEHDENEKFLDRSFFGKHERTEGRYGGAAMADEDAWTAKGLDAEILALGALAIGLWATIDNWQDNVFSKDAIFATISVANWKPGERVLRYRLEAHESMPDRAAGSVPKGVEIASGATPQLVLEASQDGGGLHVAKIEKAIGNKYNAVRLVYSLFDAGEDQPVAQGEVWESD
ncbi:T6SS effector BTH_I2691 family protein [Stenotrophomonas sp.]|uniref:T6SS effector BTH_I2691 family protein n=1 Tax=Stenotrophomonas sp. TaxID=69392 RepID=UPI0028AEB94B|nr:T6SS effector BTH_I2691 family protein [Stenotrophomonas sp.]